MFPAARACYLGWPRPTEIIAWSRDRCWERHLRAGSQPRAEAPPGLAAGKGRGCPGVAGGSAKAGRVSRELEKRTPRPREGRGMACAPGRAAGLCPVLCSRDPRASRTPALQAWPGAAHRGGAGWGAPRASQLRLRPAGYSPSQAQRVTRGPRKGRRQTPVPRPPEAPGPGSARESAGNGPASLLGAEVEGWGLPGPPPGTRPGPGARLSAHSGTRLSTVAETRVEAQAPTCPRRPDSQALLPWGDTRGRDSHGSVPWGSQERGGWHTERSHRGSVLPAGQGRGTRGSRA